MEEFLKTLVGKKIDAFCGGTSSVRGEVVVFAFGASWLPLTRTQMEGLKKLADQYAGRGVVSFGLAERPTQGTPSLSTIGLIAMATPLQGWPMIMKTLSS